MNFRHPMRFFFSSAVCLLLLAGCAGRSLEDVADESSLARFRALPADAEVLVSLHGEGLAEHFTGTRPVGALGEARLVMAPPRRSENPEQSGGLATGGGVGRRQGAAAP